MSLLKPLANELKFTLRDRTLYLWLVLILCLSSLSVGFGLAEVHGQKATIQNLIVADQQNRLAESAKFKNWGSSAYYGFHLTYDKPSDFTFAAIGQRDEQAWKHRIRMLALEGQIYEQDVGNPSVALIGRFDFSFLAAFVFPLVLIALLYDLRVSERTAGRFSLLESTVRRPALLWGLRAFLRAIAVFLALITPMLGAGLLAGTNLATLMTASFVVFVYAVFWSLLCYLFSTWRQSGSVILMSLISIWLLTAVVIPAGAKLAVDRSIALPAGAEILMSQREAVNDAWDLPREVTMVEFFERHPEWSDYMPVESAFEWQWYYAFQQVGDQKTEPLTKAYHEGRLRRDRIAAWASLLAPPSLLERKLQALAGTDMLASIAYEQKVRAYHARLREFYYPKFFRNAPFDKAALEALPEW